MIKEKGGASRSLRLSGWFGWLLCLMFCGLAASNVWLWKYFTQSRLLEGRLAEAEDVYKRQEVFRLSLSRDLRFDEGLIRLTDHKGKGGKKRTRWAGMHPELAKALRWWVSVRPCQVDNVFMQIQNDTCMGLPFRQRNHLMPRCV